MILFLLLFRLSAALNCTDPVLDCQFCNTTTGLVAANLTAEGRSCDDGLSDTSGERCRSGVCVGYTLSQRHERTCETVRSFTNAIESLRSKPLGGWSYLGSASKAAWSVLGFSNVSWSGLTVPIAVTSAFSSLSASEQAAVTVLFPPRCSTVECSTFWTSDELKADTAEQWDARIFGCFECNKHSACDSIGWGSSSYCAGAEYFSSSFIGDLANYSLNQAISNFSGFCRPSLDLTDVPVCFARRDFVSTENACRDTLTSLMSARVATTCPALYCSSKNSACLPEYGRAWNSLRSSFPSGLADTLLAAHLGVCRFRSSYNSCVASAPHCEWINESGSGGVRLEAGNFSGGVCAASVGTGFSGASSPQSVASYFIPGAKQTSNYQDIPVKTYWEEFLSMIFFCKQFSNRSNCESDHLFAYGKKSCYWEEGWAVSVLNIYDPTGSIPSTPGPCRPCCAPVSAFSNFAQDPGAVTLGYWWIKNCESATYQAACEGAAAAQVYCVWVGGKVCQVNAAMFMEQSVLKDFAMIIRERQIMEAVCYYFGHVVNQCSSDQGAACISIFAKSAPTRPTPFFCPSFLSGMATYSTLSWTAVFATFGVLGWNSLMWSSGQTPAGLEGVSFFELTGNVQGALRQAGWSGGVWDLKSWCGQCTSNLDCEGKLPGSSYCGGAVSSDGVLGNALQTDVADSGYLFSSFIPNAAKIFASPGSNWTDRFERGDFFSWQSGVCHACVLSTTGDQSFPCVTGGGVQSPVEGCGLKCLSGFTIGKTVRVGREFSVPYADFECPALHCVLSTAGVYTGACLVNRGSLSEDLYWRSGGLTSVWSTASAFCKGHQLSACDADPHCHWEEKLDVCQGSLAVGVIGNAVNTHLTFMEQYVLNSAYCDSFNERLVIPASSSGTGRMQFSPSSFLGGGRLSSWRNVETAYYDILGFRKEICELSSIFFPNSNVSRPGGSLCEWESDRCRAKGAELLDLGFLCGQEDILECGNVQLAGIRGVCHVQSIDLGDGLLNKVCVANYAAVFENWDLSVLLPRTWLAKAQESCLYHGGQGMCETDELKTCLREESKRFFGAQSGIIEGGRFILVFVGIITLLYL